MPSSQVTSSAESGQSQDVRSDYGRWDDPENDRGPFTAWRQADGTLAQVLHTRRILPYHNECAIRASCVLVTVELRCGHE
jgi:hypothetical protein